MIKPEDSSIEVHNLTVSYDKKPVLWDVDFILPKGEIIGIIGPNGSGKTTLLKSIMGLIPSNSGHVSIFNKNLDSVRNKVAYVPQRESVDWDFPASVMDIVLMGRYKPSNLLKKLKPEDKQIAVEALKQVKMLDYSNRQISQLSGGQQQRVFLARALAQKADLYIMDEPFVGVDAATEEAILELMADMKKEGKTVIVVHHDLQTAAQYFNWIVLLNTHLVAYGTVEQTLTRENMKKAFGGKLTILSSIEEIIKEKEFPIREKGFEDRKKQY